ncbi:MAG: hypothetical protein AB1746_05555 [Candidatus Zixiibacteriota bacterium]
MSTKEIQEKIIDTMKRWQKMENASVVSTGAIIEKTRNPIVKLVMELIQRDSQFHYHVQKMIAESLEGKAIALSPDELGEVWEMIEDHMMLEERTVALAQEALTALKGKKMLIQEYLLNYLLEDEMKHSRILDNLQKIKAEMYPYA